MGAGGLMADEQPHARLTRDAALLELHGRLGREVEVTVSVEVGDSARTVVDAVGPLRSWRDSGTGRKWAGIPREDNIGLYDVGSASFNFTYLNSGYLLADPGEAPHGVRFELAAGVVADVVWGVEED